MMWPVIFELGAWCAAAFAVTVVPRTDRRWALFATAAMAALLTGVLTRLVHGPAWHAHMVDPFALAAATASATAAAIAFAVVERRSQQLAGFSQAATQSCPSGR